MRAIASIAAPSLTRAGFAEVLTAAKSPARDTATECYDAALEYSIDPAFLLAIFCHESSYGKAGQARKTHNWGNLRKGPLADEVRDGWAWYFGLDAWIRSAKDAARLLALYDRKWGLFKPLDIFTKWAPSKNGNVPAAYAASVLRLVRSYRRTWPEPLALPALEGWAQKDPFFDAAFLQRNELWASRRLGTEPSTTIGGYGCLLCAAARMVDKVAKVYWSPWELNKRLVEIGGYADGNLLRFASMESFAPVSFIGKWEYNEPFTHEDEGWARELLETSHEILVKVDFDLYRRGLQQHWLHLEGISDDERWEYPVWKAYDPWYGTLVNVSEFYSPPSRSIDYAVWGLAIYKREG